MINLFSIRSFLSKQGKLRGFPPLAISTFLSLFPHVVGNEYHVWAGIQSIEILYSWPVGIVLILGTLGYMGIVYEKKEWIGSLSKNKRAKFFKIFGFAFLGLTAALTPYYLGVGNFFLGTMDMLSGGENQGELLLLSVLTMGMGFIVMDMFNSLDGKSGILYKMPPRNMTPMKKYSKIEYKVKKFFKEI
ncbi:MAG: hypothetical protein IIC67_03045 [Thaumarchaeota archaeon]|nr:hypothetical protein [Nitrososphaerota archaeon]